MKIQEYKDKNILIAGFGKSGFAAAELLVDEGFRVKVSDKGTSEALLEKVRSFSNKYGVKIETGGHSRDFFENTDLLISSPGVDLEELEQRGILPENCKVISEIELGYHFCPAPIIAITGTNGKTTTTELTGAIFRKSGKDTVICGNIGNPLCGEIGRINKDSIVVMEVSSFQLEHIVDFRPFMGILLNIAEDHYDRHGGFCEYKRSKFALFENQTENDMALIFSDLKGDPLFSEIKSRKYLFGKEQNCTVIGKHIKVKYGNDVSFVIDAENMRMKGRHNIFNAIAAICAARLLHVPDRIIKEAVLTYEPPSHRFQLVGSFEGVRFIDDSKATNIDSTRAALESLEKNVILIAGGIDKGGDYSVITGLIQEKVKAMIIIGQASETIQQTYSKNTNIIKKPTLEEAVDAAWAIAESGDTVLLSPMCSSFDMFSSYKHRGEVYQAAVKKISRFF